MAGILLPAAISVAKFSAPVGEPTYTQIFAATMGDLGTPADGFDKSMADLGAIADALNSEMVAEAAIGSIDTALGVLGAVDLAPLDSHIGNYEAAMPTGAQIVADTTQTLPPFLGELPIAPSLYDGIGAPPAQISVDLGTLKLNSAPVKIHLGQWFDDPRRGMVGMSEALLVDGDPAIFKLIVTRVINVKGVETSGSWDFQITPAKVGKFQAQVNTIGGVLPPVQIRTYTLTVVA